MSENDKKKLFSEDIQKLIPKGCVSKAKEAITSKNYFQSEFQNVCHKINVYSKKKLNF